MNEAKHDYGAFYDNAYLHEYESVWVKRSKMKQAKHDGDSGMRGTTTEKGRGRFG